MKLGKNIDNIYRDKFKEARMTAPGDSWDHILAHLEQVEKKRSLVPLWLKLTGVAAVVALLFTISNITKHSASRENTFISSPVKTDFLLQEIATDFDRLMKESEIMLKASMMASVDENNRGKTPEATNVKEETTIVVEKTFVEEQALFENPSSKAQNFNSLLVDEGSGANLPSHNNFSEISSVAQVKETGNLSALKETSEGRFELSTKIAPVYFSSFGKGNPVDKNFSEKESAGEFTFSYGINLAYRISEKINVRSGVHKVDLAYNTREVSFTEVAATTSYGDNSLKSTTLASSVGGILNQKMGFYEVPLELEYVVLNKEFELGLIGGISALLLEKDQVSLSSLGQVTDLGHTNNINNLSFTSNLGVSFGYNVSKQLEFNMEPVVKFQLNTFKNNEGSGPYFFGIYSGLNYKF